MHRRILIVLALVAMLLFTACDPDNSGTHTEWEESQAVDRQQAHYQVTQPIPFFQFSQLRASLIQIYAQVVRPTRTYTVISSEGTGSLIFECPSIGFPIPADTQLTNPAQVDWTNDVTIDQAEPGGIFTSRNTTGTYIQCIRANGDVGVVYTEQEVTAFGFGVVCNENGYCIDDQSSPTTLQVDIEVPTE